MMLVYLDPILVCFQGWQLFTSSKWEMKNMKRSCDDDSSLFSSVSTCCYIQRHNLTQTVEEKKKSQFNDNNNSSNYRDFSLSPLSFLSSFSLSFLLASSLTYYQHIWTIRKWSESNSISPAFTLESSHLIQFSRSNVFSVTNSITFSLNGDVHKQRR